MGGAWSDVWGGGSAVPGGGAGGEKGYVGWVQLCLGWGAEGMCGVGGRRDAQGGGKIAG